MKELKNERTKELKDNRTRIFKNHSLSVVHCSLFIFLLAAFCGCDSDDNKVYYEGPNYVLFADSLMDMPVTEDENRLFDVYVGTTQASDVDRNYIVDVEPSKTNAIEGYHFELLSRNVTIKAGERTAQVQLKGYYNRMNVDDSLAVTLKLVGAETETSSIYKDETNIRLYKCMPLRIDDYVGDVRVSATFPFSTSQVTQYLIKTEKKDEQTLILKSPFDGSHDLVLKFHPNDEDPFDNDIDMTEQIAFIDANYGEIAMRTVSNAPSYYLPSERAFVLYLESFMPLIGSFGAYYYIFEWITPEQAEAEKNGLTSPYSL